MTDHAADRIMQGLSEALAHATGQMVSDQALHIPAQVDVSAIRHRVVKAKRTEFALATEAGGTNRFSGFAAPSRSAPCRSRLR